LQPITANQTTAAKEYKFKRKRKERKRCSNEALFCQEYSALAPHWQLADALKTFSLVRLGRTGYCQC